MEPSGIFNTGMIKLRSGLGAILMEMEAREKRTDVEYTPGKELFVCGGQA